MFGKRLPSSLHARIEDARGYDTVSLRDVIRRLEAKHVDGTPELLRAERDLVLVHLHQAARSGCAPVR
jgi:hypothetical protein